MSPFWESCNCWGVVGGEAGDLSLLWAHYHFRLCPVDFITALQWRHLVVRIGTHASGILFISWRDNSSQVVPLAMFLDTFPSFAILFGLLKDSSVLCFALVGEEGYIAHL